MGWIVLAAVLLFGLLFAVTSPEVNSKFKMEQNRRTKTKVLEDFDAERNFVDRYSK